MGDEKNAIRKLLEIYDNRNDLQEVFPEVKHGDYQALINWAAGTATGRWNDSDINKLKPFSSWFCENEKTVIRPIPKDLMLETLEHTDKPMRYTLLHMTEETDIVEHLVTLYMLTIELNLKNILELGTRTGESTVALVEAASKLDGHVWSVDIDITV